MSKTERNKKILISIILGWCVLFIFLCLKNVTQFYWDSVEYWNMTPQFIVNGRFVFNPQNYNYRGYMYPLFLGLMNGFGRFNIHVYWIVSSLFYSFMINGILPCAYERVFNDSVGIVKRMAVLAMLMLFWPGLFEYPLTDLPAVLLSIFALYILYESRYVEKAWLRFVLSFVSGLLCYTTLNFRATYKGVIFIAAGMIIVYYRKSWKTLVPSLVFFAMGVMVVALPQIYANYINYGVYSFDNPLSLFTPNRMSYLLFEGAVWNRMEGYVGADPTMSAAFTGVDPVIKRIFEQEGILLNELDPPGLNVFIGVVLKYPLEFAMTYLSHLIECFDVRYGNIYSTEYKGRYFIQSLSILIYYIMGADMMVKVRVRQVKEELNKAKIIIFCRRYGLIFAYLLFPFAISLVGHIEPRYAVGMLVLVYAYVAYRVNYVKLFAWIKRHPFLTVVSYVFLFLAVTMVQNWSLYVAYYIPNY